MKWIVVFTGYEVHILALWLATNALTCCESGWYGCAFALNVIFYLEQNSKMLLLLTIQSAAVETSQTVMA